MDELLKKILALPIFSVDEWNIISNIVTILEDKTEKGLKDYFLTPENQSVLFNSETTSRTVKFLNSWPNIAKELIQWNLDICTKWSQFFESKKHGEGKIGADDLLPLIVLSIPNELTKLELSEIQNKLDQISFTEKGHISYCITNLYIATGAKLADDQVNETKVILFYLYIVYKEYGQHLLEQIQQKVKNNPERLALYFSEIGRATLDGAEIFNDELQKIQKKHPDFCNLLEKHKIIHDLLITLSRNSVSPEKLLIEFEAKFNFYLEILRPLRATYFFTTTSSTEEIKTKKIIELTTWFLLFMKQKKEMITENVVPKARKVD